MTYNAIKIAMFGCLALTASFVQSTVADERPPNIVMILVDDLGIGDLSCYGSPDLRTPNIDKLVASGIRFENFYANCCVCSPTRASLLTGRFPELVGVPGVIRTHDRNNWGWFDPKAVTLPTELKRAGYETAIVGKWHLGLKSPNTPNERGFDHFHGFLGDMMDDYYHHRRHDFNYMRHNDQTIEPAGHATDLFTKWSVEYLRNRRQSAKPFFLYLAYNAPHTPIQPPADWLEKVVARAPNMSPKRAKLVALIEHLDDGIGDVLDSLDANGQAENTIVIFSSDNGGQLGVGASNGLWRGGKTQIYEGGIRVPTCVRWPGKILAGSSTDIRAMTIDFFPTILEAARTQPTQKIEGISILQTLLGKKQAPLARDDIYSWLQGGTKEALRRGPWKITRNVPDAELELFHVERDPFESNNLASSNPSKLKELSIALQKHRAAANNTNWKRPGQK